MRLRIRGPSGQSPVSLEDNATVADLRKTITAETSLSSFNIKYGYPPKELALHQYSPSTKLVDLDVKLNGEQLIISAADPASQKDVIRNSPLVSGGTASKPSSGLQHTSPTISPPIPKAQRIPESSSSPSPPFSWTNSAPANNPPPIPTTTKPAPPPMSLSRKPNPSMSDPPELPLPHLGGTLLLRIMPDDNSCLFRALATAVLPSLDTMTELRSTIAQTIQSQPSKYTKAILDDQNPDDYCRWIQSPDSWGGQIELDILSNHFNIEICSIDVQTLRVDRYNESASTRCILVYSGIHYDTIALTPFDAPPEDDIKVFDEADKDEALRQAVVLCERLQERHYYTDTSAFKVKCNVCNTMCVGERGATEHAAKTGHYDFGEASS